MANNDYSPEMQAFIVRVMKEATAQKQQIDCKRNGTFMSGLSSKQLEVIFWGLFVFVIVLLGAAATSHAKSENIKEDDKCHPDYAEDLKQKHRKQRIITVLVTTVCFFLAASCVAIEGITGTALNYCHQHQFINFYWAMWGIIQIGTFIAIFGVTFHQWASLREQETPPWSIALGTPILVIAAGCFFAISWIVKKWKQLIGAPEETKAEQPEPPAGTIHGIANDGAIIVQFYGDEWKNIAAFRLTSEDKHGGATGRLTMCSSMKRHSLDPGMSQRTLMGTESNGPPAPSAERVSDAGHMV